MADINPDDLAKTVESIILALTAMGVSVDGLRDKIKKEVKDRADSGMKSSEITKLMITQAAEMRKTTSEYKSVAKSLNTLRKGVEEGTVTNEKMNESLRHLRREIDDTTDENKRARLMEKKSHIEAAAMRINAEKEFSASLGKMATSMGATMIGAFTNAAKAAMSGQDAMSQGAEMMKSQWDTLNTGVQAGANGLQKFGESTAGAGGKVGKFGIIASGAGAAISFLSNSVTELAKAGIGFMLMQTNKMIAGFQTMSSAGALYVGGMTAMTSTALSAGMTIEQFSKVVSDNKTLLSKFGGGVASASKKLAGAMAEGGDVMRMQMFALGMTMEEQADTYASVMGKMAGTTGKLDANYKEISDRALEYAKNIKMLAEITGEDMAAKRKKIEQENDEFAFQLKLNQMEKGEREKFVSSMEGMDEVTRKAVREITVHGVVRSDDVGVTLANNSGLRKVVDEVMAGKGKLNEADTLAIRAKHKDETMAGFQSMSAVAAAGFAGDSTAQGVSKLANESMTTTSKISQAAIKEVQDKQKKETEVTVGKDGKPVSSSTAASLMEANQDNQVKIQKIATENLGQFATALSATIKSMEDSVKGLVEMSAGGGSMISKVFSMDFVLAMLPTVATLVGSYMTSKALGGIAGGINAPSAPGRRQRGGNRGNNRGAAGASAAGTAMEGVAAGADRLGGGVGKGITGILSGIAQGVAAFGNVKVLLGIGNLLLLGGAVMVMGMGFKQFMEVKWEDIGKAVVGIGLIASVAAIIGIPAVAGMIAIGALAIAGLGLSIGILGAALKGFPTGLFDGLTDMFSGMGDALGGMFGEAWSAVSESFSNAWGVVKKFASDFIEPFKGVFGWISDKVTVVTEKISGAFKWAFGAIGEKITWVWDKVSGVFGWMADAAGTVASAIGAVFKFEFDIISGVATWLGDKISGVWESVTGGAKAVGTAIKAAFTGSIGWVSDKIEKLGDTFSNVFKWIKGIAKDMFAIILDPIKAVMNLFEGAKKLWDKLTGKSTASTPEEKATEEAAEKQEDAAKDFVSASNLFFRAVNKFASVVDTMVKGGGVVGRSGPANAGGTGSGQAPAQTSSKPPEKVEQTAPPGKPSIPESIKPGASKPGAGVGAIAGNTNLGGAIGNLSEAESKAYAATVAKRESGGNIGIVNSLGYSGKYQFGAEALADTGVLDKQRVLAMKKAGMKNKDIMADESLWKNEGGRSAFLKDEKLQDETFRKYTNGNLAGLKRAGVLSDSSSKQDTAGYLMAAHLKGVGGAKQLAQGNDNADAYGTKASDYYKLGAKSLESASASATESAAAISKAQASSKVATDLTKSYADKTQAEKDAMQMGRGRKGADAGPTTVDAANKAEMDSLTKRYGKTVNAEELRLAKTTTVEPKSPWDGGENARVRMNSATVGMENHRVPQYRNESDFFNTVAANRGIMPTEITGGIGPDGKRGKDPMTLGFSNVVQIMSKVADFQEQSVSHQQSLVGLADDSRGIAQRSLRAIE